MKRVTYNTPMRISAIILVVTFLFSQASAYAAGWERTQHLHLEQVGDNEASATGARLKSEIAAGAASAGGTVVLAGAAKVSAQALGIPRQLRPVNPPANRIVAKMAILDWDGTFSLIRAGWEGLMSPWIAAIINGQWLDEKDVADIVESVVHIKMLPANLHHDEAGYHVTPAIRRLLSKGKLKLEDLQWTYQMIEKNKGYATSKQFLEAVKKAKDKRTGYKIRLKRFIEWLKYRNLLYQCARRYSVEKPAVKNENAMLEYEARLLMTHYLDAMLETLRKSRLALLEEEKAEPADYLVEDGFDFLRGLGKSNVRCYIVTGSEARTVKEEVEKLGLTNVIPLDNVRGCDRNDKSIAKKEKNVLIDEIIEEAHKSGFITDNRQIWGFGDGRVENQVLIDKGCVMVALRSHDNERFFKDMIEALGPAYVLEGTYTPKDELVDFMMCRGKYPLPSIQEVSPAAALAAANGQFSAAANAAADFGEKLEDRYNAAVVSTELHKLFGCTTSSGARFVVAVKKAGSDGRFSIADNADVALFRVEDDDSLVKVAMTEEIGRAIDFLRNQLGNDGLKIAGQGGNRLIVCAASQKSANISPKSGRVNVEITLKNGQAQSEFFAIEAGSNEIVKLSKEFTQAITVKQTNTGRAFYLSPEAPSEIILALAFLLSQHPNMRFLIFANRAVKERLIALQMPNIIEANIIELQDDGEITSEAIRGARKYFGDKIININCYYDTEASPPNWVISETFNLIAFDQITEKEDLMDAFKRMQVEIQGNDISDEQYQAYQTAAALARAV